MDHEKATFLFGAPDAEVDPSDDGSVMAFFEGDQPGSTSAAAPVLRSVVARQILDDTPPETWLTARRLLDLGLDRDRVFNELLMALLTVMRTTIKGLAADEEQSGGVEPDAGDRLVSALASLPLLDADVVAEATEAVVADEPGISIAEALRRVTERLDRSGDEVIEGVVAITIDELDHERLVTLSGGRLVHLPSLTEGIVLTHRLTEDDLANEEIEIETDLAGFGWREDENIPEGWLEGFAPGDLVAARMDSDGLVHVERLRDPVTANPDLLAAVRAAYDDNIEGDLPMPLLALVAAVLLADRGAFATPQPPLSELCPAAGLEVRDGLVSDHANRWLALRVEHREERVELAFDGDEARVDEVLDALDDFEDADASPAELRGALGVIDDAFAAGVVVDELLPARDSSAGEMEQARAVTDRLRAAARRPHDVMMARWISALVDERAGDAVTAEAHLHAGFDADASFGPLIDRLAWYAADRGEAAKAARLWHLLEEPSEAELAVVERFAHQPGAKLGRNEPCWCGSGRKFKACHLGKVERAPLPDRVAWLCAKARSYLQRTGRDAIAEVFSLASCRALHSDDDHDVEAAMDDPIVMDAALVERGWFERFVAERGPLLPHDEELLAASWLLVERTVYEVEDVRPGERIGFRDLRTGERLDVRERTLSKQVEIGQRWCGRAVPDGQTHQIVGAVFPVAPGREPEVLDLCDRKDANGLCHYVGSLHAPPTVVTRENEPIVLCTVTLRAPNPVAARQALDKHYDSEDGEWAERFELAPNDVIRRAQLTLDGDRIVVETQSTERADRVLGVLRDAIPGLEVLRDERVPFAPGDRPGAVALDARPVSESAGGRSPASDLAIRAEIQEQIETRWLDEHVPALGGLTPREAVADPTRRGDVERLLATFPEPPPDAEYIAQRPSRLRHLLGLDPRPE